MEKSRWFKSLPIAVAMTLGGALTTPAWAQTVFDTTPSWNSSTFIFPIGKPNTATYGQTFVAPVDNILQSFTFYLKGSATLQVQAEVYAWSGSLTGGHSTQGATGSALFTSAPIKIGPTGGVFVPVVVNTGGTLLTAGSHYIALFSISGPDPTDYTNSSGTDVWGVAVLSAHVPNDGGGGFNFDNNGSNFAALTGSPWDDFADFGDSAWTATFSLSCPAGTPGYSNCHGQCVSSLAQQYGGMDAAASALAYPNVKALQDGIRAYCGN